MQRASGFFGGMRFLWRVSLAGRLPGVYRVEGTGHSSTIPAAMHEHTPSEETPEPTGESEAADSTGAILLHVFLVGAVLVVARALASFMGQPDNDSTFDLSTTAVIVVWLSFAVYTVLSTVGAILSWRRIWLVMGIHVGALVLALPGGIALLALGLWLRGLFHG